MHTRWRLTPLRWEALHIELYGHPAAERFPAHLGPDTSAGHAAMIACLNVEAAYLDAVDEGKKPKFPHLLLAGDDVYRATVMPEPEDGWDSDWAGSSVALLEEAEQIAEILDAAGAADRLQVNDAAELREPVASSAYAQAIVLKDTCAVSMSEHRALRLRFIADDRLPDAPIFPYTASIEGFNAISDVHIDAGSDSLMVTFESRYSYLISRAFICEFEQIDAQTRLLDVTIIYDGAAICGLMEDGSSFEWQWSLILKICEPAFVEFGDIPDARRRIVDKWRGVGALRRVHPSA